MSDLVNVMIGGMCGYRYVLQGQYGQRVTAQGC